jgi:hypothetical protein
VKVLETDNAVGEFDVGVALLAVDEGGVGPGERDDRRGGTLPGYDEASGLKLPRRQASERPLAIVVKGQEAVRLATESIARQVGLTAQRIGAAIEAQAIAAPQPGELGLDAVDVTFGITLTAGIQALFTAQADSSVQVTITLTRRAPAGG